MKKNDWPEELEYIERLTTTDEILFGLNLYAHERAEIDYSILCLETVDLWLNKIESSKKYSKKQNIAITSVLKGRRLLRASQLQIFKGYLPEAEILLRSIFEVQLVLDYILDDPTDSRVEKYLNLNKKKTWDFRTLCENLLGDGSYEYYCQLSQYPHPFNMGRIKLVRHGKLQSNAVHDYDHAGFLLVYLGNSAVGLCEQSNILFEADSDWENKHQKIYDTDIFQKNIKNVYSKIDQGDKIMHSLLSKINSKEKNYKK